MGHTLVIEFMDGEIHEVKHVLRAAPEDGTLKVTIMVTSYNDSIEGYPLVNIRRWSWKD